MVGEPKTQGERKMNKVMIAIILGIALISLVSAEVITIEPSILEPFSIYSGESITRNITIKTDGNYLVYLSWDVEGNSSDMEGFYVDYESPIQVNQEKEVSINLSAAYNFFPDSFTIILDASTEIEKPTVIYRGGGGGRTVYKDRNITVEKIIYVNQTEEGPIELEGEKRIIWPYFFWGVFVLAIIFMWYRVIKRERKKKEQENKNDNSSNTNI